MRRAAIAVVAVVLAFAAASSAPAPCAAVGDPEVSPDVRRRGAIRAALAYLAEKVPELPDSDGTPRKQFTEAVTGLAFLLDGSTTSRTGAKSPVPALRASLAKWIDRIATESCDPERLPPGPGVADSRCLVQYVWPVGQAMLFLSELDARGTDRDEAKRSLRTCVRILDEARRPNGGWGHGRFRADPQTRERPAAGLALAYPDTLIAATNVAAIGLGAARATLGREFTSDLGPVREHYREARLRNGSFPYDTSQRSSDLAEVNAGRTAGALAAMRALSMPRDGAWQRTEAYLAANRALIPEGHGSPCLNVLHGALAARVIGEDEMKSYREIVGPRIVATKRADGSLGCICEGRAFGVTCDDATAGQIPLFAAAQRTYTTALGVLTLLLLDGRELRSFDRIEAPAVITRGK